MMRKFFTMTAMAALSVSTLVATGCASNGGNADKPYNLTGAEEPWRSEMTPQERREWSLMTPGQRGLHIDAQGHYIHGSVYKPGHY